jgi:Cu2+-exporting ATPase
VIIMDHMEHKNPEKSGHAHHIKEFKKKFLICLILTLPILALSEMIQNWFGFSITIPLQKELVFILSSIVYVYGGLPFLRGMYKELQNRQPGMMTLIGTAISVAFFYSASTVFVIVGKDFFWELATLVDVMPGAVKIRRCFLF